MKLFSSLSTTHASTGIIRPNNAQYALPAHACKNVDYQYHILMDIKGYEELFRVLDDASEDIGLESAISPELLREGDNYQFVSINFKGFTPAKVLNLLGEAGLMGCSDSTSRLNLRLIGQSVIKGQRQGDRLQHILTFEDLNSPNSNQELLKNT